MGSVIEYFATKADRYDDTDKQAYWVFSDRLLWALLQKKFFFIPKDRAFTFLDAGGGTGRWTLKILKEYPLSHAVLIDISKEMLTVAKNKFADHGYSDRVEMIEGDLSVMDLEQDAQYDFAICFHNVIGFVSNPKAALHRICSLLKVEGKLALMAPSFYHALYFSNANNRQNELARILYERSVCYNDAMPPLKVFEIEEMRQLLMEVGLSPLDCYGFPVTLYPGMDETLIEGQTKQLSHLLKQAQQSLFELEMRLCCDSKMAPRGNNILFLSEKTTN